MLHGEIKVNHRVIGTWSAVRGEKFTDEPLRYSYDCYMTYENMAGYPMKAVFQVIHAYGDGPIVLTGKVLETGLDELRGVPLTDD